MVAVWKSLMSVFWGKWRVSCLYFLFYWLCHHWAAALTCLHCLGGRQECLWSDVWVVLCISDPLGMFSPDKVSPFSQKQNFGHLLYLWYSVFNNRLRFYWPILRFHDRGNHRALQREHVTDRVRRAAVVTGRMFSCVCTEKLQPPVGWCVCVCVCVCVHVCVCFFSVSPLPINTKHLWWFTLHFLTHVLH